MGNYIENNLNSSERVIYSTQISIKTLLIPGIIAIMMLAFAGISYNSPSAAGVYIIGFVVSLLIAGIKYLGIISSEFAVTNQRVICKTGILTKKVFDSNLDKIEGINTEQKFIEGLLNIGTLQIRGSGSSTTHFPGMDNVVEFRKQINMAKESYRK